MTITLKKGTIIRAAKLPAQCFGIYEMIFGVHVPIYSVLQDARRQ
jgi:hypothetical protein